MKCAMSLTSNLGQEDTYPFLRIPAFNELNEVFQSVFGDDIKFAILKFLCGKKAASVREIARGVGMSHKNVLKYLEFLASKDVVEIAYQTPHVKLYRLSRRAAILERVLE